MENICRVKNIIYLCRLKIKKQIIYKPFFIMKKTILKSLLLGAAALTALTASAATVEIEIADIEVQPGGSFALANVYANHDNYFSAIELHFALIDGISFMAAAPKDEDMTQPWPMGGIPEIEEVPIKWSPSYNTDNVNNEFKIVCKFDENNLDGVVAYFPPGRTLLCRLAVKAAADFTGATLHLNYCKTDYSDPGAPTFVGIAECSNVDVCNITVPATGTPLAEIVASGVDNTEYTVADALHIAAKAPNCVFVTDGQGNWMKVAAEGDILNNLLAWDDIKAGTLIGTLSEANCNQTLTVTKAATEATTPVTAEITAWNLAQDDPAGAQYHFAPKTNEVIKLEGYWFNGEFRGYSNNTGQSVTADMSWCTSNTAMVDGQLYKDVVSVVQLKAPWDDATKVAADDDLAFQNYKVYPITVEDNNVVTGVETLNGDKSIVSVQYVNVAGQVANTPFNGVNMVVTRYADGSTVTTKVIK